MAIINSPQVAHAVECAVGCAAALSLLCCLGVVSLWQIKLLEKIMVLHLYCNLFLLTWSPAVAAELLCFPI